MARSGTEIQRYRTRGPMGPLLFLAFGVHDGRACNEFEKRIEVTDKAIEIAALLSPTVQSLGLELLGAEYLAAPGGAVLRLYIDVPAGEIGADGEPRNVVIEDCEAVSREVSAKLDVEDPITGHYTLEVSSPGLDRPLFAPAQFARFVGESAKVALKLPQDARRRLQGKILRADASGVAFDVDGQEWIVPPDNIDKARLVPDWAALGFAPAKTLPDGDARPGKRVAPGKRASGRTRSDRSQHPTKRINKPTADKPSSAE